MPDPAWYDALPVVAVPATMSMLPEAAPRPSVPFDDENVPAADALQYQRGIPTPPGAQPQAVSSNRAWYEDLPVVGQPTAGIGQPTAPVGAPEDRSLGALALNAIGAAPNALNTAFRSAVNAPGDLVNKGMDVANGLGMDVGSYRFPPVFADTNPTGYEPRSMAARAAYGATDAAANAGLMMIPGAGIEAAGARLGGAAGDFASAAGRGLSETPISRMAAPVAAGGAAQGAAQPYVEQLPQGVQPYVNLGLNLAGGLGVEGAARGLSAGVGAARDWGGARGYGPKTDVGGIPATQNQVSTVRANILGAAGDQADQFQQMLATRPEQLVPGSQPTTAQLAPVPGIVNLENSTRLANPGPFNQRAADQNAARIGSIDARAPADAQPSSVGQMFVQQLDRLQSGQTADLAQRQGAIQGQVAPLGGTGTPDQYGGTAAAAVDRAQAPALTAATTDAQSALQQRDAAVAQLPGGAQSQPGGQTWQEGYGADARGQIMTNRKAAADQVTALKAAIDPTGQAGIATGPIRDQVKQLYAGQSAEAAPPSGEEAKILQRFSIMPSVMPLDDVFALRQRVGDAISAQIDAAGKTTDATARRLISMKSAIDEGLSSAVDQQSQSDPDLVQRMQAAAQPAPMQPATAAAAPQTGTSVFTPAGRQVGVNYEVANLPDLIASHDANFQPNPAFPPELQPRDRSTPAAQMQVTRAAANLQPERLGASTSAGEGAPIIGPDNVVESGNGRVMSLQRAYAADGPQAQAYRQFLTDQGINHSGIDQPVLVRRRTTPMSPQDRVAFTQEANANPAASMSASERAMMDAQRLPNGVLDLYQPGEITSVNNGQFRRAYLGQVVDPGEMNLYAADGNLTLEGESRIRNALLAKAYGNPGLVKAVAETGDPDIKALGGALMDSAPHMAKLASLIQSGQVDRNVDLSHGVGEAVAAVQRARQARVSLPDLMAQQDAFSSISPAGESVLTAAYGPKLTGRINRANLGNLLKAYAQVGADQAPGDRLFGRNLSPSEIINEARIRANGRANETARAPALDDGRGQGAPNAGAADGGTGLRPQGAAVRDGGQGSAGEAASARGPDAGQRAAAAVAQPPSGPAGLNTGDLFDRSGASPQAMAAGMPRAVQPPLGVGARPGLRPLNEDELARYREYQAAAANLKDTFDSRRAGEVLAPGDYRTAAKVPDTITRARGGFDAADSQVMAKFWNKGATAAQDTRDFLAAGGKPDTLRDYAADDLRQRALKPDGSLDLKEYQKWRTEHAGALSAFPVVEKALSGAAAAQATLEARQSALAGVQAAHPLRDVGAPAAVMARYWKPGDQGGDGVRQFMRDTNGAPDAAKALDQYAVYKLRESGAIRPDNTVDPGKLAAYNRTHALALAERPELRAKLANVQSAGDAYADAAAAHAEDLKAFQKGVAGQFIGADPSAAVAKAFGNGTIRDVVAAVRGNADAEAGLKRAIVQHILERLKTTTPAGASDMDFMNAAGFRRFVASQKVPLRELFGGQGMQNFEAVAADLRRQAQRNAATSGSPTAQNRAQLKKHGLDGGGHGDTVGALIAEHIGEGAAHIIGGHPIAAMAGGIGALVGRRYFQKLRAAGIKTVNDLTEQAMLHPSVMRLIAESAPRNGLAPSQWRRIIATLSATSATSAVERPDQRRVGAQ